RGAVRSCAVKKILDFSRLTVLVIDDDEEGRAFLSEILRACDATVLDADNIPAPRRAYVSTHKLDLVMTDLALPGDVGAMFLKWLRQQPSVQTVAAILNVPTGRTSRGT